jgi:uncharacterized protein (DUF2252 family)
MSPVRDGRRPLAVAERIRRFNRGRDPDGLRQKYEAMAGDVFAFFRGTAHLFWEDWPRATSLDRAPEVWSCGDLHVENFGAFKGADRLEYFDVNDFDEACRAPCSRDVTRGACSILVAAERSVRDAVRGERLARAFVDAYAEALGDGRPRWIERRTARGVVRALLRRVRSRPRRRLLDRLTVRRGSRRRIWMDGRRAFPVSARQRKRATAIVRAGVQAGERRRFRVLDVARRFVGSGSLGVERYIVLIEGKGGVNGHALVDVKRATPSTLAATLRRRREWRSEAERIVWAQGHLQGTPPACLRAIVVGRDSFVLRELQLREDRLSWTAKNAFGDLNDLVRTLGGLLAWAHLRAAGWRGAAGPEDLVAFAQRMSWRRAALDYARRYARRVRRDHGAFVRAWGRGPEGRWSGRTDG